MSLAQTITLDAQKALTFVDGILPILEASVPAIAAAGGPIGMGISAAALAVPLIEDIINQIEAQGVVDVSAQQARLDAVDLAMTDFHGDNWKVSTAGAPTQIAPPSGVQNPPAGNQQT